MLLVRQVDHQEQCALLAGAWGNAVFSRPEPFAPIEEAAACHDEGWRAWEAAPCVQGGAPVNFTEIDRPTHVALYRAGIRTAIGRGPRTGLLVSLHGQRLYEGRGGLDPGPPPARTAREPVVRAFLEEQDAVQRELREAIDADAALGPWESAGYRLLQTWDALSIHLTWRGLSAGRSLVLPQVPRASHDPGLDIHVLPEGPMACALTPWPFAGERLDLPVKARVIEDRPYASDLELRESLGRAPWITLTFRVRPA